MAEDTQEQTEETTDTAAEPQDASSNGAAPSGAVGTGLALTVGGAVVGALVALLRGRRLAEDREAARREERGLADELTARASAAARGEEADEGDDEVEQGGRDDEEAVAVAQHAETEAEASSDGADGGSPEHRGSEPIEEDAPEPRGEAAAEPEHEAAPDDSEGQDGEHAPRAEGTAADESGADDGRQAREERSDGGLPDEREGSGVRGAAAVARAAARQLAELTGREPESVLGVSRRDGSWVVTVEVVEVARTPPTTDVLGRYELELDEDGELVEYGQVGRYVRGRAAETG